MNIIVKAFMFDHDIVNIMIFINVILFLLKYNNMTINFNYDRNFTSNYVDKQLEESPFVEMLNVGYKGLTFVKQLFRNYPYLFGDNASTLFYIEYAGKTIKPEILYLAFENMLTNSNDNIVKAKLNNIPLFTINQDPIIQWARYLQATSKFTIFEPVLSMNNAALKSFIGNNKEFNYKNIQLSISKLKPICVTNVGENIAELMIYIAYLYNFFINCKPFIFNEVISGSSAQLFMEAINNHINASFLKLINEGSYKDPKSNVVSNSFKFKSLDEFYADVNNIKYFSDVETKTILETILNTTRIATIRNNILMKNDELLNISISSQNTVTPEHCYRSYLSVIENLTELVVKNNYYNVSVFSKFPRFNENNVNYHELLLLTEFVLSGGWHPFVINDLEQYEASGDPATLVKYPLIKEQRLITKIDKALLADSKAYCSANVMLDIITGYLYQKFEEYQNEVFTHPPILMEEKDIEDIKQRSKNESMDTMINKLYLNGKFALNSKQLNKAFGYLMRRDEFKRQYISILHLANLFTILYDNKFGAKILPAYILSFIPEYLNLFMSRNKTQQTLDKFDFVTFFTVQHKDINLPRLQKLCNMEMSILYLYNKDYVKFINNNCSTIIKILQTNSHVIQPYMIGTKSSINAIPIGGVSLGYKFIDSNPLTRGYWFVVNTQGNSENIDTFYKFIKNVDDKTMLDLFEKAIKEHNDNYLKELINTSFEKLLYAGKLPSTLMCYDIDVKTGKYQRKTSDFYLHLQTSNDIPIYKLLYNFAFDPILAKDSQDYNFFSRQIFIDKQVSKPLINTIEFGEQKFPCSAVNRGEEFELPFYDFSSLFKPIELSFVQPNGYKLIKVYTPNGELIRNNLFFIFTKFNIFKEEQKNDFPEFNVYDSINNGESTGVVLDENDCCVPGSTIFTTNLSSPETSVRRVNEIVNTPNHTFSTHRMKLNGVDKQPIPNVKNKF